MKKVPYGIASFEKIKEYQDYYYIDKTRYIEELENLGGQFIFFLRPRRFGKSLFLSMLESYYDIARKDQFESLFGDTYIGQNPTPLKNSFPILKLNFSGIAVNLSEKDLAFSFALKIRDNIISFYRKYSKMYNLNSDYEARYERFSNAGDILNHFIEQMYDKGVQYYMLIDEYDNFANHILIHHGKENYTSLTHKGGFLRSFFAAIKNATETRTVERMFATGVSPLVLSDVTSGMNIGDNISSSQPFNSMVGFTDDDVATMLDYYIEQKAVKASDREEILEIMKVNYNNYCFSEKISERVYNSDMVLYFFNKYFQEKNIPSNFLDENVRIDYGKLQFLILESKKLNGNFNILTELLDEKETETELIHSFDPVKPFDVGILKSLLYYWGFITIKEHIYSNKFVFSIPNKVTYDVLSQINC